ncbi:MAG: glutamate--tRNA ligase [Gammaproteobacteria bacterium]|nr:glutamate--tRNA ligase [Gammaproteobacteria bacterium]
MRAMTLRTRFAPSPTGHLHVGNARTALFSALLAAQADGEFILRIEDTDAERSRAEFETMLLADLAWLGLHWQEGPDLGGPHAPYRQSERSRIYRTYIDKLAGQGRTYPCFCTPGELALARKIQLAAGRPPRYAGTCARLTNAEIETRLAQGLKPALRFRVPDQGATEFDDLIRGAQRFAHKDIGDFVIRRADGSPAFFFSNALDDALMGVTQVLRGEDHLANTPRQLLILEALGLHAPRYGHLPLVLGAGSAPLSKREGGGSLQELRSAGILPEALVNYLARLGHVYAREDFLSLAELVRDFNVAHIGHAPAHFDHAQLEHWQREAIKHADSGRLWNWLAEMPKLAALVPAEQRADFIETVRGNLVRPAEARVWADIIFGERPELSDASRTAICSAGPAFFDAAIRALPEARTGFAGFANAVSAATGARGRKLFMPLRAALTGLEHGPEMERIWPLLTAARVKARLQHAAVLCK